MEEIQHSHEPWRGKGGERESRKVKAEERKEREKWVGGRDGRKRKQVNTKHKAHE